MKILMVCLGNICRSPLAQGILEHLAVKHNVNFTVDSAGTNGYHIGEHPHHLSIKVAKENGIDISKQRCRKFARNDVFIFDKIYVMDAENYKAVKSITGLDFNESKVQLILNESYPSQNLEVPDPWYGNIDGYYKVYDMLYKACEKIVEKYH
jgi:protein-tyrosine phosphatase